MIFTDKNGDPMGMEKYGKFDFSRWKCKYLAQNQPKSMMAQWLCWGQVRLFKFQFHALLVRGLLSTGCTLNFLRKVLKLKSEKTKLNLSVCRHQLWPVLGQTFTFQGKKSNLPFLPISRNSEIATGAYYPKLEFENHKNQYFSWLLRSEHVKTNIFGNRMTKLTI